MHELKDKAARIGVTLDEKQLEQFKKYYDLLTEWNRVMNLTAITEKTEVMHKHFIDSLLLAKYMDFHKNLQVRLHFRN